MLDRLRKELQEAFRDWLPARRNTKEKLEELARNLPSLLRRPGIVSQVTAASAAVGALATLAAPFTFGTSLVVVAAAGAGAGAAIGFGASYLSAEAEEKLKLGMVQGAIDMDRGAYAVLQLRLDFLKGTFTSSTKISTSDEAPTLDAAVSDVLTRATRFADSSVLPRNITQLVKSSLDRNRGSTSPIVQEIMGILNNLNCRDETEMPSLVESFIAEAKFPK